MDISSSTMYGSTIFFQAFSLLYVIVLFAFMGALAYLVFLAIKALKIYIKNNESKEVKFVKEKKDAE